MVKNVSAAMHVHNAAVPDDAAYIFATLWRRSPGGQATSIAMSKY